MQIHAHNGIILSIFEVPLSPNVAPASSGWVIGVIGGGGGRRGGVGGEGGKKCDGDILVTEISVQFSIVWGSPRGCLLTVRLRMRQRSLVVESVCCASKSTAAMTRTLDAVTLRRRIAVASTRRIIARPCTKADALNDVTSPSTISEIVTR